MKFNDIVYGTEDILEPVLLELIECPSMQRLKDISQLGLPKGYDHRPNFSRFEHSSGVLILLHRLNASVEEQIVGLLHDVSHTAFSHVADSLLGDPTKEDFQDNFHENMIASSEIPEILSKYGFDYKRISQTELFGLLERPAPMLCADRFDYTVRELAHSGDDKNIHLILSDVVVFEGKIMFSSMNAAKLFAYYYGKLQKESWGQPESRARYHILSETIKEAVKEGIIFIEDLFLTDKHIMSKLESCANSIILKNLTLLKNGFTLVDTPEGVLLKYKYRHIDPDVLIGEKSALLSELFPEYGSLLRSEMATSGNFRKVVIMPRC